MVGTAKYYIIYNFFKYILISIFIFIGLIWVSQILRILDLQHTISFQILDVMKTTILVLPSFISPISSFLLLLSSFFLNYKINSSNEIIIFKQYLRLKDLKYLFIAIMTIIFAMNFFNKEVFSVKAYHKYKIEELELRNNLKLGNPNQNEFYIDGELNIFFKSSNNGIFFDVEALFLRESQLIKAQYAELEISKKDFNLIFFYGERLSLNSEEITKTNFEKFVYNIQNREIEKLYFDKEHFNTFELINHEEKEFIGHGYNRIFQYFVNLSILVLSLKIIFMYKFKKILINQFIYIFTLLLILQIFNSYLLYFFETITFFLLNFLNLSLFVLMTYRILK
jgi:lipopolysaccharide export LptBFGC system permease protein LptF